MNKVVLCELIREVEHMLRADDEQTERLGHPNYARSRQENRIRYIAETFSLRPADVEAILQQT